MFSRTVLTGISGHVVTTANTQTLCRSSPRPELHEDRREEAPTMGRALSHRTASQIL